MGTSQEKCIGALSIIVEPLDEYGGAVQSICSAGDVVEDVVESPNLLGHWSCLLRKRLDRILLRSATHPSFFPLAANLEMNHQINPILNNERGASNALQASCRRTYARDRASADPRP